MIKLVHVHHPRPQHVPFEVQTGFIPYCTKWTLQVPNKCIVTLIKPYYSVACIETPTSNLELLNLKKSVSYAGSNYGTLFF